MRSWAEDLRFLAEHKVNEVFEQGQAECGGVGDLEQLRAWLIGHLLWNPYQDQDQLINEFMQGYYGPAAPYLRQYYDLIHDAIAQNPKIDLNCYRFLTDDWLDWQTLEKSRGLIDQALKATSDSPELRTRVERIKLSIDLLVLSRPEVSRWAPFTSTGSRPKDLDLDLLRSQALDNAKKFKILSYGEPRPNTPGEDRRFSSLVNFENFIKNNTAPLPTTNIPAPCKGLPATQWIEIPPEALNYKAGELVNEIKDESVARGKVLQVKNTHSTWCVNVNLPYFPGSQRWEVQAAVKCEPAAIPVKGKAIRLGVYQKNLINKFIDIDAAACAGQGYRFFSLGSINLTPSTKIYMAPVVNNQVKTVQIERLILIKR